MTPFEAMQAALGEAYQLEDYADFWQIMRANGEHVGLVTPEFAVQVDLSVIFFPEDDEQAMDLAEAADAFLRAEWTAPFEEVGFGISESGAIQAAEAEGSDEIVHSYELPCVTQAEDAAMVALVIEWAEQQTREFMLFDTAGPLVIAEPLPEEADA